MSSYAERARLASLVFVALRHELCSFSSRGQTALIYCAERARFELAVPLPVRQFSKLVVSATHPSLLLFNERGGKNNKSMLITKLDLQKKVFFQCFFFVLPLILLKSSVLIGLSFPADQRNFPFYGASFSKNAASNQYAASNAGKNAQILPIQASNNHISR